MSSAFLRKGMEGTRAWSTLAVVCCFLVCLLELTAQKGTSPLRAATGIAYDAAGNLYIADAASHQVWEATLGGALIPIAGTGVQGFGGDAGPATAAELNQPQGLAFGADGKLYIADTGNQRLRAVSTQGIISTFAGTGAGGYGGDGGSAVAAILRNPRAVALDATGALLVCDTGNQRVRRISGGVITTVAGNGVQGFSGDGGAATLAALNSPSGLSIAPDGRIFIADTQNHRIRVVDASGQIATVAGTGAEGFSGDGGSALAAMLSLPRALLSTPDGALLIADEGDQRVRSVSRAGVIGTVAGAGVEGSSLDGAAALGASVRAPRALAMSTFGMPVFADTLNGTVRVLTADNTLFQPAALAGTRTSGVKAQATTTLDYGEQEPVGVTVNGPVAPPQGQVQISEGTVVLGSGPVSGAAATLPLSGLAAGGHALTVTYLGDGLNPAAVSASLNVNVSPTVLTATASSSQVAYGLPLPQFSGVLSGVLPADAGAVQVSFGTSAGVTPPVGVYPLTASLTGPRAANYTVAMSTASGALQVVKAGTQATLGAVQGGFAGMPLALSASVASLTSGEPTGTVQFLDGTTVVATAVVHGGQASATYPAPPLGSRSLAVQFLGDANYLPSMSVGTPVDVAAMPDFTIAAPGTHGSNATAGGSATFTFLVSAQPGPFTGAIALSATGQPAGATVSFSPPQVVPGGGAASVVMTVQTAASSASAGPGSSQERNGAAFCAVALVLGAGLRRKRRAALPWLLSGVVLLAGCGARTVGGGTGGVLSQTYTVQVTGTATNLAGAVVTHATSVALTVQQ